MMTYLLKLSISLSLVYLFYQVFLRRLTFYKWNRFYLLGYGFICFFLPLLDIYWWMEMRSKAPQALQYLPRVKEVPAPVSAGATWSLPLVALWLVALGCAVLLLRLALQYFSLLRLRRRAVLLAEADLQLYEVPQPILPFSFGRAVYVHPAQHSAEELREIIRHEMVHVREKHSVDIVFAELLVALNWFNPFAWLLRRAIRQNLEFLADQGVLAHGVDPKTYQYLLLKVIGRQQFSIASHLNFSALKNRIKMMNRLQSARVHLVKFGFALPLLAVLLLAFRGEPAIIKPTQKKPAGNEPARVEMVGKNPAAKQDPVPQQASPGETLFVDVRYNNLPVADTIPGKRNAKGYILTVADNQGECIVIVKDRNGKLVRAITLTDWHADEKALTSQYGEIPPPPPPVAPAAPAAPIAPAAPAAPVPSLLPAPAKAPKVPDNVSVFIVSDKDATVELKNGKKEKYDLTKPEQRAAFEKKYGPLEEYQAPPPIIKLERDPGAKAGEAPAHPPIYFIDGKEADQAAIRQLSPSSIVSINVLKDGAAVQALGERGKHGAIYINTAAGSANK